MKESIQSHSMSTEPNNLRKEAFTRIDLIACIFTGAMLFLLLFRANGANVSGSWRIVCASNVRQIMTAANLYANDNRDLMPHPTWGGNLTGPDGWAYATQNKGRIPGAPEGPPSCANKDLDSPEYTNQLAFFQIGQLRPYLRDIQPLNCPQDRAESLGPKRQLFLGRPMKLTSYVMNGAIGGYVGRIPFSLRDGLTLRLSSFRPDAIALWESPDLDPFFLSDAGGNPESTDEGLTTRHGNAGAPTNLSLRRGGGHVGRFDGGAEFMSRSTFGDLSARRVPAPNRLLCEPTY